MKKIALIFPGIGYTMDRPLLYYGKKLAQNNGYDVKYVDYCENMGARKSKIDLRATFEVKLKEAVDLLKDFQWNDYDEYLFICKSLGTIIGAVIAEDAGISDKVKMVMYTPVHDTFDVPLPGNAIVFTGTKDQLTENNPITISSLCEKYNVECHVYEDANHSLETGDVTLDIKNMAEIMAYTGDFILK